MYFCYKIQYKIQFESFNFKIVIREKLTVKNKTEVKDDQIQADDNN